MPGKETDWKRHPGESHSEVISMCKCVVILYNRTHGAGYAWIDG